MYVVLEINIKYVTEHSNSMDLTSIVESHPIKKSEG